MTLVQQREVLDFFTRLKTGVGFFNRSYSHLGFKGELKSLTTFVIAFQAQPDVIIQQLTKHLFCFKLNKYDGIR